MTSTAFVEAFAALLSEHRLRPALPPWWLAEMAVLRAMPPDDLRMLWDLYDGCNSPLGFSGETIHAALNERGDGGYCAV